jgi:hypothetical protein
VHDGHFVGDVLADRAGLVGDPQTGGGDGVADGGPDDDRDRSEALEANEGGTGLEFEGDRCASGLLWSRSRW